MPADSRVIGSYTTVRSLDPAGGMGRDVYLAFKGNTLEKLYILKLLSDKGVVRAKQLRELRQVQQLDHPAIAPVVEFFEHHDKLAVVFGYLDGLRLDHVLDHLQRENERLADRAIWYIGHQIMGALASAHMAAGKDGRLLRLVHGHLVPDRIHLAWDGRVQLYGVGLGTVFDDATSAATMLAYRAPEHRRSARAAPPADVFSAAMVMWTMLTGRVPSSDGKRLTPLAELRSDLPATVVEALDVALEPSLMRRKISAQAIEHRLEQALDGVADPVELKWNMEVFRALSLFSFSHPPSASSAPPDEPQPISVRGDVMGEDEDTIVTPTPLARNRGSIAKMPRREAATVPRREADTIKRPRNDEAPPSEEPRTQPRPATSQEAGGPTADSVVERISHLIDDIPDAAPSAPSIASLERTISMEAASEAAVALHGSPTGEDEPEAETLEVNSPFALPDANADGLAEAVLVAASSPPPAPSVPDAPASEPGGAAGAKLPPPPATPELMSPASVPPHYGVPPSGEQRGAKPRLATDGKRGAGMMIAVVAALLTGAAGFTAGWLLKPEAPPPTPTASSTTVPDKPTKAPTTASTLAAAPGSAAVSASASAVASASASAADSAGASASASADPLSGDLPPVRDDGAKESDLLSFQGFLIVRSHIDADVFVQGVHAGRTNEKLKTRCWTRFVRLRKIGGGLWHTPGDAVKIECLKTTTVTIEPR